ncbi:glutathione S-transferase [Shewanella sp. NFH-SH190041]|uniref:glutathione S-transferase family protein n=1 Tax=Shewanella sp. NFH-SH190041 TaxID=2950245 RepID=UPI0021C40382|nr:glutathione binding-like protein [Shewanella sp. NFH-SH190041]BDM64207.1 glutathione S-transferase [Shewanella sp. NFH-SH190041]
METLDLYTFGSPNGIKITVALAEMDVAYNLNTVDITIGEQYDDKFSKLNERHKIPLLADYSVKPEIVLSESCAILLYLADKYHSLISSDYHLRQKTIEWLFYQAATIGPMFGAYGHFSTYAKHKVQDPYPVNRYLNEITTILNYIEQQLNGKTFLIDEQYSIADIAIFPWVIWIINFYHVDKVIDMNNYPAINGWVDRCCNRPKTRVGLDVYNYLNIKNHS